MLFSNLFKLMGFFFRGLKQPLPPPTSNSKLDKGIWCEFSYLTEKKVPEKSVEAQGNESVVGLSYFGYLELQESHSMKRSQIMCQQRQCLLISVPRYFPVFFFLGLEKHTAKFKPEK